MKKEKPLTEYQKQQVKELYDYLVKGIKPKPTIRELSPDEVKALLNRQRN